MSADLLNFEDVQKSVQGSSVVYVTVGFPYSVKVWKKSWPKLITNVIKACKVHNCKLVFFDLCDNRVKARLDDIHSCP